jgi:putative transposase
VKVHHYGIEVGGHGYHSPELAELRMRMTPNEKISVRYRDELGHVWVHDRLRNVFLQVPIKDKRKLGLSRELWNAAEKALQESGGNNPSFEQVHQCYRDLVEDVEQARRSQKLRKRRAVARAKLDKDGWKVSAVKSPLASTGMDWLDMPFTTEIATPFKVIHRHPNGGLNHE